MSYDELVKGGAIGRISPKVAVATESLEMIVLGPRNI
jgi:hypothetical protein